MSPIAVAHGSRGPMPRGFWPQVSFADGCWEWGGTKFSSGYGRAQVGQTAVLAHRRAWELTHYRAVPSEQVVMHACDNKPCVRPSHLRLGTAALNSADMVRKGRSLRGQRNQNAKLWPEAIRTIRELHAQGWSTADVARRYDVSEALVWAILTRRAWAWLP